MIRGLYRGCFKALKTIKRLILKYRYIYKGVRVAYYMSLNKEGKEVKCLRCGHKWITRSKLWIIVCASCGNKVKNKEGVKIKE